MMKVMGRPCSVMASKSCSDIRIRIVISQSRTSIATGQIAARLHSGIPGSCLSVGVFSDALVSQMTHACRAALTSPRFAVTEP
jgi:hypothetical protein